MNISPDARLPFEPARRELLVLATQLGLTGAEQRELHQLFERMAASELSGKYDKALEGDLGKFVDHLSRNNPEALERTVRILGSRDSWLGQLGGSLERSFESRDIRAAGAKYGLTEEQVRSLSELRRTFDELCRFTDPSSRAEAYKMVAGFMSRYSSKEQARIISALVETDSDSSNRLVTAMRRVLPFRK